MKKEITQYETWGAYASNDLRLLPPSRCISHFRASEKEEWALMQEPSYMRIPRPIYNKYEEREREDEKK